MRVLSVCSGIGAPECAWHPLGWQSVAVSEIDRFPSAVLAHRFPGVPNWGDMTKFEEWPDADVDVLVGGTPCQSFSVAGLRKGLADDRGNLALVYLEIARRYRPKWMVWENVPGVLSSNGGRDFGAFLGGLGQLGYGFAYRVLDAQYFGVPQRRRRVFVIGYLGDWRPPAAVLFERESLSGHPAPRREAGEDAPTVPSRRTGGLDTDFNCAGGLIAQCLTTGTGRRYDPETETLVAFSCKDHGADAGTTAPTLRAMGHNGSHANAGGQVAVAWGLGSHAGAADGDQTNRSHDSGGPVGLGVQKQLAYSLRAGRTQSVAYRTSGNCGAWETGDRTDALTTNTDPNSHVIAHTLRGDGFDAGEDGTGRGTPLVPTHSAVRRLTPRECERLQGFPDDWTAIQYRGKPAADGPRYKALGNSMAVPVLRWIGERIAKVDAMMDERHAEAAE